MFVSHFVKFCLKTLAKEAVIQPFTVLIDQRLPCWINGPVELTCCLTLDPRPNYYVLSLTVQGVLSVSCQRCLGVFEHNYKNKTQLAVCENEEVAEKNMDAYESIIATGYQIDLIELITDELHLYVLQKHTEEMGCDPEISQLIGNLSQ